MTQRSEILIRFVPFRGANLRVKSGLFIAPKHFRYFINRTKTQGKGIVVPEKVLSVTKEEADKKGYELKSYGEVVVADRIVTPEVENSKQQKKMLDDLQAAIMDAFATAHKDDVDAVWLEKLSIAFIIQHASLLVEERVDAKRSLFIILPRNIWKRNVSHTTIPRLFVC